ncbi:MAG: GNAT family N-acetyltransferase [Ginsengibacter sp.]
MMEEQPYQIIKGIGSDEELERYRACFVSNGSEKTIGLLKWNHQQNLQGVQSIYYAIGNAGEIAAIYTYLPVVFTCMGSIVNAMQSFDTLTDKDHRGKGLFIKLASKIEAEEKQKSNELVYGFPNENSVHGFVKKLKFNYFGEVPFLIKPFGISYFIKRILKSKTESFSDSNLVMVIDEKLKNKYPGSIKEITNFDELYDQFYQQISKQIKIGVNRDAAYMNWRYVKKPHEIYSLYGYYENGELKGVIIFTLKNKHGGKIGYLMELLFDEKNEAAGKHLLQFCLQSFKKNKADLVLCWCFDHSFNYNVIRKSGFYNFPEKLRPQKLGFIAKTLNSNNIKDIYNLKNWYLSYSDSDTV